MQFCPTCGTTVTWTLELFPDGRGVAGGSDIEQHEKAAIK
jgi:hypothetical protein